MRAITAGLANKFERARECGAAFFRTRVNQLAAQPGSQPMIAWFFYRARARLPVNSPAAF
jgi:hypothetical protein